MNEWLVDDMAASRQGGGITPDVMNALYVTLMTPTWIADWKRSQEDAERSGMDLRSYGRIMTSFALKNVTDGR